MELPTQHSHSPFLPLPPHQITLCNSAVVCSLGLPLMAARFYCSVASYTSMGDEGEKTNEFC